MLEPENLIGVKVLALIHSGKLKQQCSLCDDMMKDEYSCGKISDKLIYEEDDLKLYTCPLTYITQIVSDWYDEMSYYEMFNGTAPSYGNHSLRFYECAKAYKSTYNKHLYDEKDNKVENTDNELKKLKNNFAKSKRK